jgi:rfaE bifunctional protein kinase chain/domain
MVDYVVIDENAKPLENISILQPDYFAKGYEYNPNEKMNPKTQEEIDLIESYGGKVLFTPGDIVYSSSSLINLAPPQIKLEKLLTLMHNEGITFDDIRRTLKEMAGRRVHVVGDTIIDSYTYCKMIGGQTKTPTMSVLYDRKVDYIGGAAVVAKHLKAAGAEVVFSTVLGDDEYKNFTLDGLREFGVETRAIIDPTRPTVNKNAIIAANYRLLKIDTLDNRTISDGIVEQLVNSIATVPSDAVVFSDFRHGIFNRRTTQTLCEAIPAGRFKVADSQVASRWGNITEFPGFDLITPNEREARFALADQDSTIGALAGSLSKAAKCGTLILKLGPRGVFTMRKDDPARTTNFFSIDSFANNVLDPVGAGDALLAYATLAMLASGSDVIGTILGSIAAAVECEFDGNMPVTPEHVLEKLDAIQRQANLD